MTMRNLSEHVLLVTLPTAVPRSRELEVVVHTVGPVPKRDIIVSFALVDTLPSTTLCCLIILHRRLTAAGRQLILCSVPGAIRTFFRRVGLEGLFRFATDMEAALESLGEEENIGESPHTICDCP